MPNNIIMADAKGGDALFELIGEETFSLPELTGDDVDNYTTGINISNTNYAWLFFIVTCDTPILTNTEWGMTTQLSGRYTIKSLSTGCSLSAYQKGVATLNVNELVSTTQTSPLGYGVYIPNNIDTVQVKRKCNSSALPKIRAGNYTVKAYGLKSLG